MIHDTATAMLAHAFASHRLLPSRSSQTADADCSSQ